MSNYTKHLYAIMYPNHALVASQLEPEDFGKHYSVGTKRYYSGKMVFLEVGIDFRNDYFELDKALEQTVEHEDGSPKHTKFVSSYRVLEHLDTSALGSLFLATVSGETVEITGQSYEPFNEQGRVRIIQELNPVQMLAATTFDHKALGKYLTDAGNPKGAPKLFFTEYDLDVDLFLETWERNPLMSPPIPGVHPQKLKHVVEHLLEAPEPGALSIGLQSVFDEVQYSQIKHGFFLAAGDELLYYPMPSQETLERKHYAWWKSSVFKPR